MAKTPRQKAPLGSRQSESTSTIITDPRFSNIHTDPRYRLPSKKHTHVKLDKRFSHMLRDGDFSRKASVDRYGRRLPKDTGKKELERFYRIDEENGDGLDDDEEVERELKRVEGKYDPAREGGFSSSSESSSEEEEEEEDDDGGKVVSAEEDGFGLLDEQAQQGTDVPMGEVSSRLAVVNLDWDNIRAVDLMAAFSSFKPPQGRILKVTVYPSEFGRERMEREEMEGPPKEIFTSNAEDLAESEDASDESEESDEEMKKSIIKEDAGEEFDSTKLRQYQLERLRYYYAVITFDSPETAKAIYDATDGTEYLTSANFFDLRFIPDAVSFDEDVPRDEATDVPDSYRPNEFVTDALQHSKVKLTWDADDGVRKEVVRKAFGRKEAEEQDLRAYLGSDSSDEDDARQETAGGDVSGGTASKKEAERKRLRDLLGLGEVNSGSKRNGGPIGDMQITFSSGLAGSTKNKGSVFEEPEETTVEKYIRRERERKQRRKEKKKEARASISESADAHPGLKETKGKKKGHGANEPVKLPTEGRDQDGGDDDLGFDDPFFATDPTTSTATAKTSKERKESQRLRREKRARDAEAEATRRAELELLMLDDDHVVGASSDKKLQHFDISDVFKAEKAKNKKYKKGKKAIPAGAAVQEGFKMDVDDPRFSRLWEEHDFAIDPTNPRFRKTEGMKKLLEEGRKKRRRNDIDGEGQERGNKKKVKESSGGEEEVGDELKRLVERVKGRHKSAKKG